MKLTFFSNYLNHLQTPLCDEFYKQLRSDFTFVSTEKMPEERLLSGYQDCTNYIYNLNSYSSKKEFDKALELGIISDVVIIGSAPDLFIQERLKKNKLTFRYYERFLKKGKWILLDPRILKDLLHTHTFHRNKNLYMLCASAFTANDVRMIAAYPKKTYKWGYFTEVKQVDIEELILQKRNAYIKIIWVGRFLVWKHPEMAVQLAHELKKKGYQFHLNMIGAGPLVDKVCELIDKLQLSQNVSYLGSLSNEGVRNHMYESSIFIFTSDRNEGWGVVLNEAMSCGCAVVASSDIGAVPYLINNGINGLIFKSKKTTDLIERVELILKDDALRENLGTNAYKTMTNQWNPQKAASNLLLLSSSILNNYIQNFDTGPCSIANFTKVKN